MNARQKAKKFKKLYEEILPQKPYPVVYKTPSLKHYRISHMVNAKDMFYSPDNSQPLRTLIENKIMQELRPLIWNNLKTESDLYSDNYRYLLDIWIESSEASIDFEK